MQIPGIWLIVSRCPPYERIGEAWRVVLPYCCSYTDVELPEAARDAAGKLRGCWAACRFRVYRASRCRTGSAD